MYDSIVNAVVAAGCKAQVEISILLQSTCDAGSDAELMNMYTWFG